MSSTWGAQERRLIAERNLHNTGQETGPSPLQEFGITLLSEIARSPQGPASLQAAIHEIARWIAEVGPDGAEDAWYNFTVLIYSAAMSAADDDIHRRLISLVFSLARMSITNGEGGQTGASEAAQLLSELKGFGWVARDLWNGPKTFTSYQDSPREAQTAWVNLNRFVAHLSCQQRKTPVDPLQDWLEDFGLWTISDGLEDPAMIAEHAEPAAAWLTIASRDIYNDLKWGARDGNPPTGVPRREGPLWTKRLAAGVEQGTRWDFWKGRLREIAADNAVDPGIGESARVAGQAMKSVEGGS